LRELEEDARKYTSEAIRFDSQGAHGTARLWIRLTSIEFIRLGKEGWSSISFLFHNLSIPSSLLEPCLPVVDMA
jgi:hypothetical protein